VWNDYVFLPADADCADEPDYWLVYDGLSETEAAHLPAGRVIFVAGEPEAVHAYRPAFLAQFGLVLTPQRRIEGPRIFHTQAALPWHAGVRRDGDERRPVPVLGYDDFRAARIEKTHDLSVVCSTKSDLEGQRQRLAFVERMQEHFGDRLHWFGRGVRPIEDKWDAVAPYRFHISLENSAAPDYWTEKLADAYLGGSFPLYWGCPNLDAYFERDAFETIDVSDPARAARTIEQFLSEGITPRREAALRTARDAVLDRYNLFPAVIAALERCGNGRSRRVQLRPESEFNRSDPTHGRVRRLFARIPRSGKSAE
jgi:hypothetical protein